MNVILNFNSLDSAKVMVCDEDKGKEFWKLVDSISFKNEDLPGTDRRAAASIADELTTVGESSNMLSVNRQVSGSILFDVDHGMKMALQDLRALDLESDIDSKRMLLQHRSIKREFSNRVIEFRKDSVFIGQYVIPIPDVMSEETGGEYSIAEDVVK